MASIAQRTIDIHQTDSGWRLLDRHYGKDRTYKTARAAQMAAERQAKKEAQQGLSNVLTITWHYTNIVGKTVIEALT